MEDATTRHARRIVIVQREPRVYMETRPNRGPDEYEAPQFGVNITSINGRAIFSSASYRKKQHCFNMAIREAILSSCVALLDGWSGEQLFRVMDDGTPERRVELIPLIYFETQEVFEEFEPCVRSVMDGHNSNCKFVAVSVIGKAK